MVCRTGDARRCWPETVLERRQGRAVSQEGWTLRTGFSSWCTEAGRHSLLHFQAPEHMLGKPPIPGPDAPLPPQTERANSWLCIVPGNPSNPWINQPASAHGRHSHMAQSQLCVLNYTTGDSQAAHSSFRIFNQTGGRWSRRYLSARPRHCPVEEGWPGRDEPGAPIPCWREAMALEGRSPGLWIRMHWAVL